MIEADPKADRAEPPVDPTPTAGAGWTRLPLAALGTALAVGALELAGTLRQQPYGLIPFVTSIALVIGLPDGAPARPRALIGGHLVSTLVGYAILFVAGPSPVAAAIATGLAVAAMLATRTMHPPAGIDPFLIVNDALGLGFLLGTVLPGACLLAGFAILWREMPGGLARLSSFRSRSRAGTAGGRSRAHRRRGR